MSGITEAAQKFLVSKLVGLLNTNEELSIDDVKKRIREIPLLSVVIDNCFGEMFDLVLEACDRDKNHKISKIETAELLKGFLTGSIVKDMFCSVLETKIMNLANSQGKQVKESEKKENSTVTESIPDNRPMPEKVKIELVESYLNDLMKMCSLEEKFNKTFVKDFLKEVDQNKDGQISIKEVTKISEKLSDKEFLMKVLQGLVYGESVPPGIQSLISNISKFNGIDVSLTGLSLDLLTSSDYIKNYANKITNMTEMFSIYDDPKKSDMIPHGKVKEDEKLVFAVGFSRTGDMSLKEALVKLGYSPCHDWIEIMEDRDMINFWDRKISGAKAEWDEIFQNHKSAISLPINMYWQELMVQYPQAKFILTTRDPDEWYKSYNETVLQPNINPSFGLKILNFLFPARKRLSSLFRNILKMQFGDLYTPEHMKNAFTAHNKYVLSKCPKNRLLHFNLSDGWDPLCKFLEKEKPAIKFPLVNNHEEIMSYYRWYNRIGTIIFGVGVLFSILGLRYIRNKILRR